MILEVDYGWRVGHGDRAGSPDCYGYGKGNLHCVCTDVQVTLTVWPGRWIQGVSWEYVNASEYLRRTLCLSVFQGLIILALCFQAFSLRIEGSSLFLTV